jgi:spore coat polysaccharide biosynthesis protein SpsF
VKIYAIVQVRVGSTRLPRKVLLKLNESTLLEFQIEQLRHSKLLDDIVIATTENKDDDIIHEMSKSLGVNSFRGSEEDVLDRYYNCAKHFSMKHIVRINGDAPFIDPQVVDKVIDFYKNGNFDYVSNFFKKTYPAGTEVEVFSFDTLKTTWENAKKSSEREHVTPYIYNNPTKFRIGNVENNENVSNLHWTVDRKEDLDFVREIYHHINKQPILLSDILKILKDKPSLLEINKNTNSLEGYQKSLENDKKQSLS